MRNKLAIVPITTASFTVFNNNANGLSYDMNRSQPVFHTSRIPSGRSESLQMLGVRSQLHYFGKGFLPIGRSIGAERHNNLVRKIIFRTFEERPYSHRCGMPPDRTAYENHIVIVEIFHRTVQFGTDTVIQFFTSHLRTLVVIRRIGIDCFYTEYICTGSVGYSLGKVLGIYAPTEIGKKNIGVCVILDGVMFVQWRVRIFRASRQ